ncbi:hypothetical protein DB057_10650 [Salmonella enterica]|uniref:Uncharacterized protein n=3 Tax=Salmonella enterica I TaxID=59201 RepID=A0A741PHA6_SALET|nr:hypothetical protein [Salmonella enterica]ECD3437036.1 hypothetical protein [Salmonella enterica subsp. enterica]ECG6838882.1 hypothetical protein [Salmonella enterica subsp. enterica serovar Typhimurium]EDD5246014.1 hypothetical protein [Salmonella enterica subsp. enterica serovar Give]EDE2618372.1 hypothetical protein [Salmonella enterica subsp. enterica serovar Rissen]EDG7130437.1 hypothetical protein [Salmonella enterica subsp. enterica serovar Stanley]EDN3145182.1 hypothetical protein
MCTHGSLTDPAATRARRAKIRSKKLCKFVHYRACKFIKNYRKKAAFAAIKITCREKFVCAVE